MTYQEAMREASVTYLRKLLKQTHGNVTRAAEQAGVSRSHFYRVLSRAGIEPPKYGHRFARAGNAAWRSLAH